MGTPAAPAVATAVALAARAAATRGGGLSAAFLAVFAVFVAAFLVLAVVTVRWAVRRDRKGRAEWVERQLAAAAPDTTGLAGNGAGSPRSNGRRPARGGQRGAGPRRTG